MSKRIKDRPLDPAKYGMILCPEYKGTDKFLDPDKKISVCSLCDGFGFIKKKDNISDRNLS